MPPRSGHGRLAAATGATIHVHGTARPISTSPSQGWELNIGTWFACTGHHRAHRVSRYKGQDQPWAVLTGTACSSARGVHLAVDPHEGAGGVSLASSSAAVLRMPARCGRGISAARLRGPGMDINLITVAYSAPQQILTLEHEDEFVERHCRPSGNHQLNDRRPNPGPGSKGRPTLRRPITSSVNGPLVTCHDLSYDATSPAGVITVLLGLRLSWLLHGRQSSYRPHI